MVGPAAHGWRNGGCPSDVRQQIEVLVVFVLAAFSFADRLLRFDELDALDPLDHLVAKLVFDAQPQRRSVHLGQRLARSSRSQHAFRLEHVFDAVACRNTRRRRASLAKREKRDDLGVRLRPDELDQRPSSERRPTSQCRSTPGCSDAS